MDKEKSPGWKAIEKAQSREREVLEGKPQAKEQSQTKPQTKEQSEFDNLYDFIKTRGVVTDPPTLLYVHPLLMGEQAEQAEQLIKALRPVALKIMESGIFYDGGLKGWHLCENHYKFHPIKDLNQFIYELSNLLYMHKLFLRWSPKREGSYFSKGVEYLELFEVGVQIIKGRRAAQLFRTALRNLKTIEKEISAKPDLPPKPSKPALKQKVVDIFRKHIKAPASIMSERIAKLLAVFDISAAPGGIGDLFKKK